MDRLALQKLANRADLNSDIEEDPPQPEYDYLDNIFQTRDDIDLADTIDPAAPEDDGHNMPRMLGNGNQDGRAEMEDGVDEEEKVFIESFKSAGTMYEKGCPPLEAAHKACIGNAATANNPFAPFKSKLDWELAHWAKTNTLSESALTCLLGIDELANTLRLSFETAGELNEIIDEQLPWPMEWKRTTIGLQNQSFEIFYREPLDCVRKLFSNPIFKEYMSYRPEKLYCDATKEDRQYNEFNSGDWWWETQVSCRRCR
jgi:hypothetical protein